MNINIKDRQKVLTIAVGALVLVLVLDRLVFTPLGHLWTAHSTEIAKLQATVANGRAVIARGPQSQRVWNEMQQGALPKDAAQAEQSLFTAFDTWGRAAGIELGSIKPQWKRGTTDRFSLLECRIDATGSLANLTRFLFELEKSPLALRVESVEMTARDESGSRLTLGLVISGLRLAPLEGKR